MAFAIIAPSPNTNKFGNTGGGYTGLLTPGYCCLEDEDARSEAQWHRASDLPKSKRVFAAGRDLPEILNCEQTFTTGEVSVDLGCESLV